MEYSSPGAPNIKAMDWWHQNHLGKIFNVPNILSPSPIFSFDSKLEELVHFLQVMYPKLCQHWQVIWMMATVMLVLTVVLGLYSSYNSCVEQADGPHGRSTCSAAQRDSWWSSGLQHEQPAEQ